MVGPLVAIAGTWGLVEYTRRRAPQAMLPRMIWAFGAKMLFLAAYMLAAIRGIGLQPVPFLASFVGYFVVFYAVEAFHLKRIMPGGNQTGRTES
jgi:hypothetical protein